MKVFILAGGFGTRLSEYTDSIPKPMVEVGGKPILWHIMNYYASQGYNDFYIALGYKANSIKKYFIDYHIINADVEVNLGKGSVKVLNPCEEDWNITLIDTGLNTLTGGRVKRLGKFLDKGENFFLTYGDGLSNVNLDKLIKKHNENNKLITVSAVRSPARFGEINLHANSSIVESFAEKTQLNMGWINGGFFVINEKFLEYIDSDDTILEKKPLEQAAIDKQLVAYFHNGFWQCMDTKRDKDFLEEIYNSSSIPPWLEII